MVEIFLKLLNISLSASLLIAACIIIRYAFKSMPKYMRCILWVLVLVRLVCPFRLESSFSLLPQKDAIVFEDTSMTDTKADDTPGKYVMTNDVSDGKIRTLILAKTNGKEELSAVAQQPEEIDATNDREAGGIINKVDILLLLSVIWIIGIVVSLIYGIVAYIRLIRCVDDAVRLKENVYQSDRVATPFVLGIFKTRIYIPYNLSEKELFFVLSHERAHISRKDHMLKPAAYLISCIYWFNPLVWVSYMLLCRDIELACDEKAIRRIGYNNKKEYSQSILDLSVPKKYISACPVAFGETGVKERVKSVLNMKKGTAIAAIISAVLIIIVGVGFLTYPKTKKNGNKEKPTGSVTESTTESNFGQTADNKEESKSEAATEEKQSPTEASKDTKETKDKTFTDAISDKVADINIKDIESVRDSNEAIKDIVKKIAVDDSIGGDSSDIKVTLVDSPIEGGVNFKSEDSNHEYTIYLDEEAAGSSGNLVIYAETSKEDGNEVKVITSKVEPYSYKSGEEAQDISEEEPVEVEAPEESIDYSYEEEPENAPAEEPEVVVDVDVDVDDVDENVPYTISEVYGLENSDVVYICNDCKEKNAASKVSLDIKSVISGTVQSCGYDDERGNYIEIKDENGHVYTYTHLQEKPSFKAQDTVKEGQVIGKTGNSGKGPKLPSLQITVTDKNGNPKNIQIYMTSSYEGH